MCGSEATVPLVMLTQQQQLLLLWPRDHWKEEKNRNGLMWMYITHHGSLRATYAVAVMLSGHTTVCKAFLEKCGILSEIFTGITERGAYTVMQSEWPTGLISDESQSSQTVGCLGRGSQISNMLFNKLIMMLWPAFQQDMYIFFHRSLEGIIKPLCPDYLNPNALIAQCNIVM